MLASRAAFFGPGLDDVDAVNFALALQRFDPVEHRPHPPGAPVHVAAARVVHAVVPDGRRALAWLSAMAQALAVIPLFALFRALGAPVGLAAGATALTLLNPVVWINGARPMSDSLGWLLAVGAQALSARALAVGAPPVGGALLAALAVGARVQAAALAVPIVVLAASRAGRGGARVGAVFVTGCLAWAVPLMVASGGPSAYVRGFLGTAADALPVEPLILRPTAMRVWRALLDVAILPWGSVVLGVVVVALAAVGAAVLVRRRRAVAVVLAVAFVPYLVAHTLFQQVSTLRYAIPYVPLLAGLAAFALVVLAARLGGPLGRSAAPAAGLVLAAAAVAAAWPGLRAYRVTAVPAVAAVQAGQSLVLAGGADVLAGHYVFRRFFEILPAQTARLALAPGRELAGLADLWLGAPDTRVAFVAEPYRTDLEAIDPEARTETGRWQWPRPASALLSGERPRRAALVLLDQPRWFASRGFLLSLEQGRVEALRDVPARSAFLRRSAQPSYVILAGRPTAHDAGEFTFAADVDGRPLASGPCSEALLSGYDLPPLGETGYAELRVSTRRAGVAAGAPFALNGLAYGGADEAGWVHGQGWHWPETDREARPFRWASADARSLLRVPSAGARLEVAGSVPRARVGKGVKVTLTVGEQVVEQQADDRFAFALAVRRSPAPWVAVRLQSDRQFVPGRGRGAGDRRPLALKVDRFRLARL